MATILIVEDEPSIAESLVFVLEREGFTTHWVTLGAEALAYLAAQPVQLIILDVGLPDMSGFEACRRIRKTFETPILFLTARGEEVDRIVGLELGADDYVVKPFSPREVAVRVRGILRRVNAANAQGAEVIPAVAAEPFHINEAAREIRFHGHALALTKAEFLLLRQLLSRPGEVFGRDALLTAMGAAAHANYDRNIDTHIKSLRAKLRAVAPDQQPIKTARGFGYSVEWDA